MKKLMAMLMVIVVFCGVVMAADLTPASKEDGVKVNMAQVVTNGQAVVIGAGLNVLTGVGSISGYTNTITLVAPSKAGLSAIVVVGNGTNKITVADSGTVALSAAFLGDQNDALQVISIDTSTWVQTSTSAN